MPRVRTQKSAAPAAAEQPAADVAVLVASLALPETGDAVCVVGREFWPDGPADVTKLEGVVSSVQKSRGSAEQRMPWIAELPGAAAPILAALEKGDTDDERVVFWSPLAPTSLFVTTEQVREGDDVHVIAKGDRVGDVPQPHATLDPTISKAFRSVRLHKTAEERFVLGIVLEPDVVDAQNDVESPDEIRKAAHRFMEQYGNLGTQHTEIVTGKLRILESYVAPSDFQLDADDEASKVRKGSWVMGIRVVDDDLWTKVKKGEFTGFSIGGSAYRTELPSGTENTSVP